MIGVLHTARINAIEFVVSSDKLTKMVNFKLGNEMWRWINQHDTSVGQRKNSESPTGIGVREVMGLIPVGDSEFFLCPMLVSCWLIHLHISLPSLKFTIFINRAAMGWAQFMVYPWFFFRFVCNQTQTFTRPNFESRNLWCLLAKSC